MPHPGGPHHDGKVPLPTWQQRVWWHIVVMPPYCCPVGRDTLPWHHRAPSYSTEFPYPTLPYRNRSYLLGLRHPWEEGRRVGSQAHSMQPISALPPPQAPFQPCHLWDRGSYAPYSTWATAAITSHE